jgi:hypothetical protein
MYRFMDDFDRRKVNEDSRTYSNGHSAIDIMKIIHSKLILLVYSK